ncbi:MAG: radical SAM protein [Bacteroidales bacterium]|nr:radical SAM protein [Bacteroidales bacterium]
MSLKKPICNAPFVNIYIDVDGNVTPCCFNRDDVLGNIFTENIENIWHSDKAQNVRKQLLNKQFPKGCYACEKALQSKNYYNSGIFTFSKLDYKAKHIQAIDFELSYWCNLSCIMCNLHSKKYSLTYEQENTIIDKIAPLIPHLKRTRFYGGEPLLIPIYRKIWKQIIEINPRCNILLQTNGMLLDDELIELSRKGNFTFNVSLDSLDSEVASKIRKGSQLDIVLNNIQKMKTLSKHDVSLAVTPMTLNWKEIPEIVKYANKNKLIVYFNTLIQPPKMALWYLHTKILANIYSIYSKKLLFPLNYYEFKNMLIFKHFVRSIKNFYILSLTRPNYSDKELEINRQKIFDALIKVLPDSGILNDPRLRKKIDEYLYLNKVEDGLWFIQNADLNLLENKLRELLNNE